MIEIVIPFRSRSIGVMDVRRGLPFAKRRSVGPFVFVDDFGPIEIVRDRSLDVLPHPHIPGDAEEFVPLLEDNNPKPVPLPL
jgi:redox-sensitive bicupin YhaK (pirin superfamily)